MAAALSVVKACQADGGGIGSVQGGGAKWQKELALANSVVASLEQDRAVVLGAFIGTVWSRQAGSGSESNDCQ